MGQKSIPRVQGVPGWVRVYHRVSLVLLADMTTYIVVHLHYYITSEAGLISLLLPRQELGQSSVMNNQFQASLGHPL